MARRIRVRGGTVINPNDLSTPERARLVEELGALHRQIFAGVDLAQLRRTIVESPAAYTRIQLFYAEHERAVGFIAIHVDRVRLRGRTTAIIRCEVGTLRKWRGASIYGSFFIVQLMQLLLRNLFRPCFFYSCPVHPSSYMSVTRRALRSWPRPGVRTPPEVHETMLALADRYGLPVASSGDPTVREVGWITRQDPKDRTYWERHEAPEVRYFCRRNPGYTRGDGLILLAPVTPWTVLIGTQRHIALLVKRWLARRRRR